MRGPGQNEKCHTRREFLRTLGDVKTPLADSTFDPAKDDCC